MNNTESTIQIEPEQRMNKPTAISTEEKIRRAEALADAIASVELEGFPVAKEYTKEAQRFVSGEIDFSALTQMVSEYIPSLTNKSHQPIATEERQRREDAVNFATASVGLEGFKQSSEAKAHALRFINGEIDLEEYLAKKFQAVHGTQDLDC